VRILLDTSPLSVLTQPTATSIRRDVDAWVTKRFRAGDRLIIPEIADYEVRRELLRAGKLAGIGRLDELCAAWEYDPLTTGTMQLAAQLWADARNAGRPAARDTALDGHVILAAQARSFGDDSVIVATSNPKHLEQFVDARPWGEI